MIMIESAFLALIAVPIGVLMSFAFITFFGKYGVDLSFAAAGLKSVGLGSHIYPYLDGIYYVWIGTLVVITSLVACAYPARKALKLNPSETLRTAI